MLGKNLAREVRIEVKVFLNNIARQDFSGGNEEAWVEKQRR
jgi:hypothetical protein